MVCVFIRIVNIRFCVDFVQILLFGTAVYNGSIITFDDETSSAYQRINADEESPDKIRPADAFIQTEKAMASPALQRSPLIYKQLEQEAELQQRHKERRSGSLGSAPPSLLRANSATGPVPSSYQSLEAGEQSNVGVELGSTTGKDGKKKSSKKSKA